MTRAVGPTCAKQDDVFAVRLVNKADHEVAATLTLDGLHALRFSEIKDRKTQRPALVPFLVPARQSVLIRGWPINLSKSDEFLVTSYAKSAAKELNSDPGKIGVIGVQFAAAWKVGANPPADEPKGKAGENIGRGSAIDTPFQTEERKIGVPRAMVSIRYKR